MRPLIRKEIEARIADLASTYSASKAVSLDDFVSTSLGIDREDAVEFFVEIERIYEIDLRSITETQDPAKSRRFWRSNSAVTAKDPRLSEIVDLIMSLRSQN